MEWLKKPCLFFKSFWLIIIIFLAFIFILFIFHSYWSHFHSGELSDKTSDWANFGSYFGGTLSPILAFFSFLALCHTINLQNKQLTIQRFEGLFTYMANELSRKQGDLNELSIQNILRRSGKASYRYAETRNKLGINATYSHFCIYLYQILKLIDDQDDNVIPFKDKKRYSNIIRSSLDKSSMQLCFLNNVTLGAYDIDFAKYRILLEKYSFFEHMPFQYKDKKDNSLYDYFFLGLAGLYDFKAFGNNIYLTVAPIRILNDIFRTKVNYVWVEKDGKKNQSIEIKAGHPIIVTFIENEANNNLIEFNLNSLVNIIEKNNNSGSIITFKELKFVYKNQDYQLEIVFPNLFFEVNLVLTNLISKETTTFNYEEIE